MNQWNFSVNLNGLVTKMYDRLMRNTDIMYSPCLRHYSTSHKTGLCTSCIVHTILPFEHNDCNTGRHSLCPIELSTMRRERCRVYSTHFFRFFHHSSLCSILPVSHYSQIGLLIVQVFIYTVSYTIDLNSSEKITMFQKWQETIQFKDSQDQLIWYTVVYTYSVVPYTTP